MKKSLVLVSCVQGAPHTKGVTIDGVGLAAGIATLPVKDRALVTADPVIDALQGKGPQDLLLFL